MPEQPPRREPSGESEEKELPLAPPPPVDVDGVLAPPPMPAGADDEEEEDEDRGAGLIPPGAGAGGGVGAGLAAEGGAGPTAPIGGPSAPGGGIGGGPTAPRGARGEGVGGPTAPGGAPGGGFGGPTAPGGGRPPPRGAARRASRRRMWLYAGAGALVVGLGVVGIVLALSGGDEGDPGPTTPATPVVSILAGPCTADPGGDEAVGGCETPSTSATFAFEATSEVKQFQCSLEGGRFAPCVSPHTVDGLSVGEHSFSVRASGPGGRSGAESFDWTVIEVPQGPLPDLVITFLDSTRVVVENRGEADAGPFVIEVRDVARFSVPGLAGGGTRRARLPECARGELTAVADREGTVVESDEENNEVTQGPFTCPDLVVAELTSTSVTVENLGDGPASESMLAIGGLPPFEIPPLAAGQTVTREFECEEGPLEAGADAEGEVLESDEGNNALAAGPFVCESPPPTETEAPLPDLVVAGLDATSVTVANIGDAAAAESEVEVGGVGTFAVEAIEPGGSFTETYPCTEAALSADADASELIEEIDERNNSFSAGPFVCPKPDLIISALDGTVVSVANIGDAASAPTLVSVSEAGTFDVPELQPGGEVTFELPECPATTVTAQADPRNRVEESDEDNNGLQAGPFKCPDLIVEFDGSTGVLRITNAGTAQAGESRATVDGMSFEVPALDPGDSFSRDFCGRPGLTATVDVDGVVFESDEDNNSTPAGPCDTVA